MFPPRDVLTLNRMAGTITELVELWITARSYAPTSAKQRRCILGLFVESVGDRAPQDITPRDVLGWWACTEGLSPATRRSYHVAVGGFLSWCRAMGYEATNVLEQVRRPSVPRHVPKVLTIDEEQRLRSQVAGVELELPVLLMLDMGLRRAEVSRARAEDVSAGWMVVHGKGGAVDRVPVAGSVAALMPESGRLAPWSPDALAMRVKTAMRHAGIHGHGCHSLRRTFGTRLMAGGASAVDTMRLLRHSNLATTTLYVRSQFDAA